MIAAHVRVEGEAENHCYLDPCAGDGEAIFRMAREAGTREDRPQVYTIEMEHTRHEALHRRAGKEGTWRDANRAFHGDAFGAVFPMDSHNQGATFLYLNPPYDLDPTHKRLEERFLSRFTGMLAGGGVLVFVVPFYALKASAATLARHYRNLACFRFPGGLFADFKQVVLFAERQSDLETPDADVVRQVEGWAADAESIPAMELPEEPVVTAYPLARGRAGFGHGAHVRTVDMDALMPALKPWGMTDKGGKVQRVEGVLPACAVADLLTRTYRLAMPPKAQHIATGVAAGIFNGTVVYPDNRASGLPALLLKGSFRKEWRKVEEKVNDRGEVVTRVEVQAPELVVSVFDLSSKKYHTLPSSTEPTLARHIPSFNTADLLSNYGGGMMRVMLRQCPVSYDPANPAQHFPIATMARKPYKFQEHVIRACVLQLGGRDKPLRARQGEVAYLLGEIGSGKTFVALGTLKTIGAKRPLVLCPPHLLDGWEEQIAMTWPEAKVGVLRTIHDLTAWEADTSDGPRIAILSREAAKLSHSWLGVGDTCPGCGGPTPEEDLAKKRLKCELHAKTPGNLWAQWTVRLAARLYTALPAALSALPHAIRRKVEKHPPSLEAKGDAMARFLDSGLLEELAVALLEHGEGEERLTALRFTGFLLSHRNPGVALRLATLLWWRAATGYEGMHNSREARSVAAHIALALPDAEFQEFVALCEARPEVRDSYSYSNERSVYVILPAIRFAMTEHRKPTEGLTYTEAYNFQKWDSSGVYDRTEIRGSEAVVTVLRAVAKMGQWSQGSVCGTPLFQADPEGVRRVPLADMIVKRHPTLFDTLVIDELQEYATEGSAQERAAHLLMSLRLPTIQATGTFSNGYASSMFLHTWASDPNFRAEFDRDGMTSFVDRYGYRKRVVQDKDGDTGKVVAYGSHSDRVQRSIRITGHAPGVLPLFVLKYVLNRAAVMHKTDMALDIPPMTETRVDIEMTPAQKGGYQHLQDALVAQMKEDQFGELSGKLFGALSELPSYLDRCTTDVGNQDDGTYQIRYPEEAGHGLVAQGEGFSPFDILPKERWMLDKIREEIAEGRKVMVFGWHTGLLPRLQRLIERECMVASKILDPGKVPTAKRQAWITKEVLQKDVKVLLTNPKAVETGLNNLVEFATIIVMENPACNPLIYRQSIGRIDRIGQTRPTRVFFPIYKDSLQEGTHRLLLLKVAVSRATDGLDAEGALNAAGMGVSEALTSMSVGRALAEWLRQREEGLI